MQDEVKTKKINLGCGHNCPGGWINVDYALGAKLARCSITRYLSKKFGIISHEWCKNIFIHDLRKPLPWKSYSIDQIYSSHTLEHLTRKNGFQLLEECHRILKKNGIIRVVVPDFAQIVDNYINGTLGADKFLDELGVFGQKGNNKVKNVFTALFSFPHLCMYDSNILIAIFRKIGFTANIRKAFESDIDDIYKIEIKNRVDKSIIIEGRKI